MKQPVVSVIIPAYNEENYIQECLQALIKQDTTVPYEIIVVDNASTDRTARIARQLKVRVVAEKKKGRGQARQAGVMAARGTYLLFTEADTVVPRQWVARMHAALVQTQAAVTGPMKIVELNFLQRLTINIIQPLSMHMYRVVAGYYILAGFHSGISKSICTQVGGFNTRLNTFDDVEFSKRVVNRVPIVFLADLPVVVSARRFRNRFFTGLWEYIQAQWIYVLGRQPVFTDPR